MAANTRDKYLIVITGPTGIGKTDLALRLNEKLQTSIISADSRQIYKEMTIGTAKPSDEEIKGGQIKLVNHVSIHDPYNAGTFEIEALQQITEDHSKTDYSILCGGTGLYIKAVQEGLDDFPQVPQAINEALQKELNTFGLSPLQKELEEKDPIYFKACDVSNQRRVVRALSIIRSSGETFSSFRRDTQKQRPFKVVPIVLDLPREELYARINSRVLKMIESGLVDEVKSLVPHKHLRALNTVGYAEVFKHLDGEWDLDQCIAEIQKNTRRYAKRQLTWSRGNYNVEGIKTGDLESVMERIGVEF